MRGRMLIPAFLATLALAVVLAGAPLPADASALGEPWLVPEHAAKVVALLDPLPLSTPFADDCSIPSVSLDRTVIRISVDERDGSRHVLALSLAPSGLPGPTPATSRSFLARLEREGLDGSPPVTTWPPCAARVWGQLRANDDGTFWAPVVRGAAGTEEPEGATGAPGSRGDDGPGRRRPPPTKGAEENGAAPGSPTAMLFYRLLQALFIGLVGVGAWHFLRRPMALTALAAPPRGDALALAAALAVSILLRALWAEPALIHEHYCGVGRIACADAPPCHGVTGNHSWASFAFYNLVLLLSGGATRGVLVANVLLMGVAQPLLVYALTRDLAGDRRTGVFAAWALALLPVHIRMSPTESFFPLAMTLLLASILSVRTYAREGGASWAGLSGLLAALTVQTAKIYNLAAPLLLAVLLLARTDGRHIRPRHVTLGVVLFAALAAPHFAALLSSPDIGATSYLPDGPLDFLSKAATNNLFMLPSHTPPALAAAWLLGAGVLLLRRPRAGGTVLALFLGLGLVLLAADPTGVNHPTRLRMQVSLAPFVAVLAGVGLRRLGRGRAGLAVLAVLVAGSVPLVPRYDALVREVLVPAHEARFLETTIPRLPPLDLIVTLDTEDRLADARVRGDLVETHFPWNELRRSQGPDVQHRTVTEVLADPSVVEGRRAVFYQAANAYAWLPEELDVTGQGAAPRPKVVDLRRRFRVSPIEGATGALPASNPPSVRLRFAVDPIPVGFYWLTPRPDVPAEPPYPDAAR